MASMLVEHMTQYIWYISLNKVIYSVLKNTLIDVTTTCLFKKADPIIRLKECISKKF